jgi:hypothetical protein
MHESAFRNLNLSALLLPAFFIVASTGAAAQGNSPGANGAANGQPFAALQQQIEALQSQIDTLNASVNQGAIEIDVDCAAGESISGAIASVGDVPNPLLVTISGTCSESVILQRNDVTLRGQSPGDGINGFFAVLASRGASHINVESMTLSGTRAGLACWNGASVTASNVTIINSSTGVSAFNGGTCQVIDSVIDNNFNGVSVSTNSNAWLRGVDVTNSSTGANVFTNSSLNLGSSPSNGSFTTISGGDRGIEIFANGSVHPVRAIIENNNTGISVQAGGSLFVDSSAVTYVQNNANWGVRLSNLASTILGSSLSITDNGGWGLDCSGTHSIAIISPPTLSNNSLGDVSPNCDVSL